MPTTLKTFNWPVDLAHRAVEMYVAGAALRTVAAAVGCSPQTVQTLLKTNNIERRNQGRSVGARLPLSAEEQALYADLAAAYRAGASLADLAPKYGADASVVRDRLIKVGVVLRPRGAPRGSRNGRSGRGSK